VQRVVDTLCVSSFATRRAISGAPGNTLAAIGHFGWRIGQDGALVAVEWPFRPKETDTGAGRSGTGGEWGSGYWQAFFIARNHPSGE
jgi:hypothetical protein